MSGRARTSDPQPVLPVATTAGPRTIVLSVVLIWTFGVTLARSVREPNQFAEAHWLLDYRFGFIKRGLIGSICSAAAHLFGAQMTESAIAVLSLVLSACFWGAALFVVFQILQRHLWRQEAFLACLVLASSPFVLMSGHLVGYFDGALFVLTLVSVGLVRVGRSAAAAAISIVALLTHESYALTGLPLVWMAAVIDWRHTRVTSPASIVLLVGPILAFVGISIVQPLSTAPDVLRSELMHHLEGFGFLGDRSYLVAVWQTTPVSELLPQQIRELDERLFEPAVLVMVAPTLLTLLLFLHSSFRIRPFGLPSTLLLASICAPLAMHAVAWDTARIWTYPIGGAITVVWMLSATCRARRSSRLVLLAAVPAMMVNAFGHVPLMDNEPDRFVATTRLLLYLPAIAATVAVACAQTKAVSLAGRPRAGVRPS